MIYHFHGNGEFPRLRIGIGRPPGQMDPKAFMLQKFNLTARERIDAALLEGAHALEQVISKGFSESSNCFNTMQKYKHIRLQTLPAWRNAYEVQLDIPLPSMHPFTQNDQPFLFTLNYTYLLLRRAGLVPVELGSTIVKFLGVQLCEVQKISGTIENRGCLYETPDSTTAS